MKYVIDEIEKVVDKMRKQNTFTVSNVGNVYTISSRNTLLENEWVRIGSEDYKVYDVTPTNFKITSETEINPGTWKTLAPYYMYGHRSEINNRLLEKDKDSKFIYQKYPLIALRMPFVVEGDAKGAKLLQSRLNIGIMQKTEKGYNSEERYEHVITPILEPLFVVFMQKLFTETNFTLVNDDYKRIDRLFWGIQNSEGSVKNIFSDPLDAIELLDLNVKFQILNC